MHKPSASVQAVVDVLYRIVPFVMDGHVSVSGTVAMMLMMALNNKVTPEEFAALIFVLSPDGKSMTLNDLDLVFKSRDKDVFKAFIYALQGKGPEASKTVVDIQFRREDGKWRKMPSADVPVGEQVRLQESLALMGDNLGVPEVKVMASSKMVLINKLQLDNDLLVDIRFDANAIDHVRAMTMYDQSNLDTTTIHPNRVLAKRAVWVIKWHFAVFHWQTRDYAQTDIAEALRNIKDILARTIDLQTAETKFKDFVRKRNFATKQNYFCMPSFEKNAFLETIRTICNE